MNFHISMINSCFREMNLKIQEVSMEENSIIKPVGSFKAYTSAY